MKVIMEFSTEDDAFQKNPNYEIKQIIRKLQEYMLDTVPRFPSKQKIEQGVMFENVAIMDTDGVGIGKFSILY